MVIVGNSVDDLQCSLNRLKEYYDHWGARSGRCEDKNSRLSQKDTEVWFYTNEILEIGCYF